MDDLSLCVFSSSSSANGSDSSASSDSSDGSEEEKEGKKVNIDTVFLKVTGLGTRPGKCGDYVSR